MLRFASSPTRDMHIGDLQLALYNYIVAKQRAENLVVRIEDTDIKNNIEGKDQEILDILDLFGITYSQTTYQSQSLRFHSAMALQLIHDKKAFSCFCSWEWIQKKQEEAEAKNEPYLYDDACANLPHELVIDNLNPFTIRINKPAQDVTINDHLKGETSFKSQDLDSAMIMKQDKTPTYNFSCAVDDMLNDISLVIRSEENINNAPIEDHVRTALKYDKKVEYAHIPILIDGEAYTIKSLLEEGFLPESIVNYLISARTQTPKDIFTLEDAIEWFDLKKLSNSPTHFDINVLREINHKHLQSLDSKELSRYVGFADEEIGELAKIYLEEVYTTKELKSKITPIFEKKEIPEEFREQALKIAAVIKQAPYFETYDSFKSYLIKESGIDANNVSEPLRFMLTGASSGPDLSEIYKYLKNYLGEIVK